MEDKEILDFDELNHLAILIKKMEQEDALLVLTILDRACYWKGYAQGQKLLKIWEAK